MVSVTKTFWFTIILRLKILYTVQFVILYICTYTLYIIIHFKNTIKIKILKFTCNYLNIDLYCGMRSYLNISYKGWSQFTKPMYSRIVTVHNIVVHVW